MAHLIQSIRDWWHGAAGDARRPPAARDVIVHDPAAEKPHDLDDPFLDAATQSRLGGAIAKSVSGNRH